ncbi:QueG-associated DUF1730 domain-containing protein [Candidatus Izimaplasma bacterium HR1]|uniref:epoxyqueuosine reductase n=1 Tax=Candidatus Izimoplasma sp. HR1 TaxID=1541959 RepID=UPI00057043F8
MKDKVISILEKQTDTYSFLNVDTYIKNHKENSMHGNFDNYAFLNKFKTIITLAFPYPKKEVKYMGKGYGILARFSYSNDYHKVIASKLDEVISGLNTLGIKGYGSVDVSKIDEKYAASLSGIGYFGKHSILINPQYGSYMFLATILIDKSLNEDYKVVGSECGDCTICIDVCPSNALEDGFNRDKCISHLSQTKMPFNEEQISYFKSMIYGCDICLKACPKNKGIDFHKIEEFEPNGIENIWLEDMLLMSKKEFRKKFGNNTSHWIGASTMRRNALCIIGNQKLVEYIPKIKKSMSVYKDNLWYNKTADIVLKKLERE